MTLPKISIVTINYNMGSELAGTIESVLGQDYSNLEYIVIDGGSTDNSVEVVQKYKRIDRWVSEPDEGRYHAMNKGAQAATGDWVIFINSGDRFHDSSVLADIFRAHEHSDADLVYGHVLQHYLPEGVERLIRAQELSALPLRMPCSHQSLFARRSLLLEHPFSSRLSIAADHDFMLRANIAGSRFKKIDRVISIFSTGGISSRNRREAMRELEDILGRHGLLSPMRRAQLALLLARTLTGNWLKKAMPEPLVRWILRHRPLD